MKEFRYIITDREGIHARPAGLLVKEANRFSSSITLEKDGKTGDAKRIFAVMGLAAKQGQEIIVRAGYFFVFPYYEISAFSLFLLSIKHFLIPSYFMNDWLYFLQK